MGMSCADSAVGPMSACPACDLLTYPFFAAPGTLPWRLHVETSAADVWWVRVAWRVDVLL